MGVHWSKKIGSDPYYASYERSFERLKSETDRLKVPLYSQSTPLRWKGFSGYLLSKRLRAQILLHRRKARETATGNTIFFYGAVGFAMAVIGAAWVRLHVCMLPLLLSKTTCSSHAPSPLIPAQCSLLRWCSSRLGRTHRSSTRPAWRRCSWSLFWRTRCTGRCWARCGCLTGATAGAWTA